MKSWGEGIFARPHGITIGPDDAVYCTDDLDHTVRKFTPDGQLLLTIGTSGVPSETGATSVDYRTIRRVGPPFHFPTNLALAPSGEMYVSDGYGNARVHKFDAAGRLLFSWGEPGGEPGQFHVPHGIAVDRQGIVYVADRENSRLQLFSAEGKFLAQWTDVARPCQVFIGASGDVFVAELGYRAGMWPGTSAPSDDATGGRVSIFDSAGDLKARWGGGRHPARPAISLLRTIFASIAPATSTWPKSPGRPVAAAGWCRPIVTRCKSLLATDDDPRGENQAMKAWRFYGFGDLRLDDVPVPECRPAMCWSRPCASSRA